MATGEKPGSGPDGVDRGRLIQTVEARRKRLWKEEADFNRWLADYISQYESVCDEPVSVEVPK
jgi:hypothetical protein